MGAHPSIDSPACARISHARKVCAWCESALSSERSGDVREQSFGMCESCLQTQLARPRILVSPPSLRP